MSYQLLILFSIIGWGVGSFFYKLANDKMHPLMVTTTVTLLYVVVTPFVLSFIKFDKTLNVSGVVYALIGGACTCVGSLGYFYAIKSGAGAGEATILTALYPALTLVLSCLLLGESFTVKKGIGIALALASSAFLWFPSK
jgi:drug/metabolite transporter (DMT)-like permease